MAKSDWCFHAQHLACRYGRCTCECHPEPAPVAATPVSPAPADEQLTLMEVP